MNDRIYTVEELNDRLPLVRAIVADVLAAHVRLRADLSELGIETDEDPDLRALVRELPWDVRDRIDEFRDLYEELRELGFHLRDAETGLVEAFGERKGEIVFYSWKAGEPTVSYWHELDRSPRVRRPLGALNAT